ncbi:Fungalysin metallopeptidase-domain-containing protein [Syncephalis fuscata]|nr:Fungalysin metallopeptidase-domain-containing protein [Syncephalis fuscata]
MHIDLRIASLILAFVGAVSCANQRIEVDSIIPKINVDSAVRALSSDLSKYKLPASSAPHNAQEIALEFARSRLHIKDGDFIVTTSHKSKISGTTHVYLQQTIKGINVSNGVMGVHVDKANKIIAYDSSFFKSNTVGQNTTSKLATRSLKTWDGQTAGFVSPIDALRTFATHIKQPFDASKIQLIPQPKSTGNGQSYLLKNVEFTTSAVKVSQSYIQTSASEAVPAWEFTIEMPLNYFLVHISADGTKILALKDLMTFASYNVVKIGDNNPIDTPRQIITDPADKIASPNGWHTQGNKNFTTTVGNNVFAQANYVVTSTNGDRVDDDEFKWKDSPRPDGGKDLNFDFAYDAKKDPKGNIDAAVTNLFYINNIMHDVFYQYGFDEPAGNFQEDNGNKGGKGGDAVAAHELDGYDFPGYRDNAFFLALADGERSTMGVFGFDFISPGRNGALQNDIMVHEYGHGVSGRLTGGSAKPTAYLHSNLEA